MMFLIETCVRMGYVERLNLVNKSCKSEPATVSWIMRLYQRCALGDRGEVIQHSIEQLLLSFAIVPRANLDVQG